MESIARINFDEIEERLSALTLASSNQFRELSKLTRTVVAAKGSSCLGEQWARTWGELTTKKQAAKMLGISVNHLAKRIQEGDIKLSPDGRVLVRSAAEWANSAKGKAKAAKSPFHVTP